ncbi:hypothetical protein PV327_007153 [Microctonus hyperodae]|uniref:Uncharacterized protein n=1 Tax=Microctonus hyperodae TaxID=165561 RepID=A0AA39KJ66_MICHY|nr:hypothetical protein PV327_007153 [Microctonus hyperodae]
MSTDWMTVDCSPLKPGLTGPYIMPMPVPMPTLYNGEAKKQKPGIIELVLYNIAAMLAGVATGYDVRMSNVSPIHPRLYPRTSDNDEEPTRWWFQADTGSNRNSGYLGADYEFSSTSGYPHNTYHGPARHYRPFLSNMGGIAPGLPSNVIDKPLRFTDSPQHYAGNTGSNIPTPSPRRKSSSASNDEVYSPETGRLDRIERVPTIYLGNVAPYPDYGPPVYTMMPTDYYRPPESGYFVPADCQDRMLEYSDFPHAYDNLSNLNSLVRPTSRLPSYTHHRTSSNVSNTSTSSQSNINPSFRLDDEADYAVYSPTHYYPRSSNIVSNITNYGTTVINHDYNSSQYLTRHNSHDSNPNSSDRPSNLEVVTRLRSSLKRSNYSYNSPKSTSKNNSGSGTPTNPTPPDSLTSEDSSYVSAKDSQISMSRVRFSPVTFDRDNSSREHRGDPLLDIAVHSQGQEGVMSPLQSMRRMSRNRKPSISDLDREFLS